MIRNWVYRGFSIDPNPAGLTFAYVLRYEGAVFATQTLQEMMDIIDKLVDR